MKHFEDHALFYRLALQSGVAYCPRPLTICNKGVAGSASSDTTGAEVDRINRINLVMACWSELDQHRRTPLVVTYLRHDLRAGIRSLIAEGNSMDVPALLGRVDPAVRSELSPVEVFLYRRPTLRAVSVLWIRACNVMRRTRGYPRLEYRPPN